MKKYNNPSGANEKKNRKAEEEGVNQGQGPEFQTEDKTFREKNVAVTPLGDLEGIKNKAERTEDQENVGKE
jgi:hypothetical protein